MSIDVEFRTVSINGIHYSEFKTDWKPIQFTFNTCRENGEEWEWDGERRTEYAKLYKVLNGLNIIMPPTMYQPSSWLIQINRMTWTSTTAAPVSNDWIPFSIGDKNRNQNSTMNEINNGTLSTGCDKMVWAREKVQQSQLNERKRDNELPSPKLPNPNPNPKPKLM